MSEIPFELRRFGYDELKTAGYGSRTTIWRKRRAGQFPEPVTAGGPDKWTGAQLLKLNAQQKDGN